MDLRLTRWRVGTVCLLGLGVAAIAILREPTEPLTRKRLDDARRRWTRAGVGDYDMTLEMSGNKYEVEVRNGEVRRLTLDGHATTSHRPVDFTVPGLFDTLERELEIRDRRDSPFGADSRAVVLRARFHLQQGYPQRYIRAVSGSGRSSAIYVRSLRPVAGDNPNP